MRPLVHSPMWLIPAYYERKRTVTARLPDVIDASPLVWQEPALLRCKHSEHQVLDKYIDIFSGVCHAQSLCSKNLFNIVCTMSKQNRKIINSFKCLQFKAFESDKPGKFRSLSFLVGINYFSIGVVSQWLILFSSKKTSF